MFRGLVATENNVALTVLRLFIAVVFFAHGAQKLFGWFGGPGFFGMMHGFEAQGIPSFFAFLAICAEFFGSLGLFAGFLTRIASLGIMINMIVAILTIHYRFGFFMNWTGGKPGEGFEYHLLAIGICLTLLIGGAGAASIDRNLMRRSDRKAGMIRRVA